MFAIAIKQEQYPTYVLVDRAFAAQLEVVPERGGLITHWRIGDQEILYFDAERFANPDLSVRGGIPLLFPICGNLPNNTYIHDGQPYTLKQHGFARDLPWQVVEQSVEGAAQVTLALNSDEHTRRVYPFDFQLHFTYRLQGRSLTLIQRFTNHSDGPMPFATGIHPYFLTPDKSALKFDIPATQYQDHITQEMGIFPGQFDWNADEIDIAFKNLSRSTAIVADHHRRLALTVSWDRSYSTLVFWTVKGKDYYCLEPWSAPRNALNTGESLIKLPAGATYETAVQLTIEGI